MKQRIYNLIEKFRSATITENEFDELLIWLHGLDEVQEEALALMDEPLWEQLKTAPLPDSDRVNWEAMKQCIIQQQQQQTHIIEMQKIKKWKWLVAAAAILIATIGTTWLLNPSSLPHNIHSAQLRNTDSIFPHTNETILTMSNGHRIVLDSTAAGTFASSNGIQLMKLPGDAIAYDAHEPTGTIAEMHTITVPRGGRPYLIKLTDGSGIWLNAASSIRYPSFFSGNKREVAITGEAYFEIAHNPAQPFHVRYNQMDIEVVGTHFNVNTYEDEKDIRITLLEGAVKLNQAFLLPGQQGILPHTQTALSYPRITTVDTELATAWVKGFFHFDKADIYTILRQVARWYDLEIVFVGKISPDLFSGKIERSLPLTSIVKLLSSSNIRIRVEGKKLVVE